MRYLMARWRRAQAPKTEHLRADQRPRLAATMCRPCAKRWLVGRSLWHPWCVTELRHGFDMHYERLRLREDP